MTNYERVKAIPLEEVAKHIERRLSMLICMKCNRTFETAAKQYDGVGYVFDVCPYCEHDDIKESKPCKQCSDPMPAGEDFCGSCREEVLEEIQDFVFEMNYKAHWDKGLIRQMMDEYLEVD